MASAKQNTIESKIRSTIRLVQVNITAATMISCEVEYHLHPINRTLRNSWLSKIGVKKLDSAGIHVFLYVRQPATAQIINNAHVCTSLRNCIREI
jgi:hypothetical protein